MHAAIEKRAVARTFELRTSDEEAAPVIVEGYASVFDAEYDLGPFIEKVNRSAFNRTLSAEPDVRLLVDHEGQPLARTKSGTLLLTVDEVGLHMRAELDTSDPDVQRLLPKMRRGDLDQMSFAFRVAANGSEWDYTGDKAVRTLVDVSLNGGDVSIVTYPASEATSASVREARALFVEQTARELRGGRTVGAGQLLELRRAIAQIEAEQRMTANDTASSLSEAISDAYSEQGWAYLEDWDDVYVYFTLWTRGDSDMYRQGYSLAADGMATLSGEAEQVRRRSTYVTVTDPDGDKPLVADDERSAERPEVEQREAPAAEQVDVEQAAQRRGLSDARRLVQALGVRKAA